MNSLLKNYRNATGKKKKKKSSFHEGFLVKQRGVVNSCTLAEVPLVYMILPGKYVHAVPLHCLVAPARKATWIF